MTRIRLMTGAALLALSSAASAYSVFPIDGAHSLKWGNNLNGTPGGVVTWMTASLKLLMVNA